MQAGPPIFGIPQSGTTRVYLLDCHFTPPALGVHGPPFVYTSQLRDFIRTAWISVFCCVLTVLFAPNCGLFDRSVM
jgi:hypothetical protein